MEDVTKARNDTHAVFIVRAVTSDVRYRCDVSDSLVSVQSNEVNIVISVPGAVTLVMIVVAYPLPVCLYACVRMCVRVCACVRECVCVRACLSVSVFICV